MCSSDFDYIIQTELHGDYRKLAVPIIAILIGLGFTNEEINSKLRLNMSLDTKGAVLKYLQSKGYNQLKIIKLTTQNWQRCPLILQELMKKYNSNFEFPETLIVNCKDETTTKEVNNNTVSLNVTEKDKAIGKFILVYLIRVIGCNNYKELKELFAKRVITEFNFEGSNTTVTGIDFTRLKNLVMVYGKNTQSMESAIHNQRVYFNHFTEALENFCNEFPYHKEVVVIQNSSSLDSIKNQESKASTIEQMPSFKDNNGYLNTSQQAIKSLIETFNPTQLILLASLISNNESMNFFLEEVKKKMND
jgi:hypothetical protein